MVKRVNGGVGVRGGHQTLVGATQEWVEPRGVESPVWRFEFPLL